MKLSRRGFMKAAPAAAMAAPEIAKEAANMVVDTAPSNGEFLYTSTMGASSMADKAAANEKWTLENLAKVKRIASGDIRDEDTVNIPNYSTYMTPNSELKSVSDRGRELMNRLAHDRNIRKGMIKQAKQALEEYDKTGLLRYLW